MLCVTLCSGLSGADMTSMSLGLSHSLSRYKLKFSPDKVGDRRAEGHGEGSLMKGGKLRRDQHNGNNWQEVWDAESFLDSGRMITITSYDMP